MSGRAPLHPEWEVMARKVLRGADPAEKLTWRTAEVLTIGLKFGVLLYM